MSTKKTIISRIIIGIILAIMIGGGYLLYHFMKNPAQPHLYAIPENSACFIELNDVPYIYNKLKTNNQMWEKLSGLDVFRSIDNELAGLDSIIKEQSWISNMLKSRKLCISLHPARTEKIESLILMSIDDPVLRKNFRNFVIEEFGPFSEEKYPLSAMKSATIFKQQIEDPLIFTINKGVFIACHDQDLLKQALQQQQSTNYFDEIPGFKKLQLTAGKKVDANLYIQYKHIKKLQKLLIPEQSRGLAYLGDFACWTEIDIIIKPDELLINGYTISGDSVGDYISLMDKQVQQEIRLTGILPYNTNQIFWIGAGNFQDYHSDLLSFTKSFRDKNPLNNNSNKDPRSRSLNFLANVGNEVAAISTLGGTASPEKTYFGIVGVVNVEKALESISGIAKTTSSGNGEYAIRQLTDAGFLTEIFGPSFKHITKNYFCVIENYLVVANSVSSLEYFIDTYTRGKTLDINENYVEFSDNISDKSNIFFYYNIRNSIQGDRSAFSDPLSDFISQNANELKGFQAMAFQFSNLNDLYYTNVYLKYNSEYKDEDLSIWKTQLDNELTGKPYLVKDHQIDKSKIIAFDIENNMYLIDHYGNIIWKLPIEEPLIGDVFPVDYYKNGKIQYLFNTENYLYIIDLKGRPVDKYPIRLNKKASSGLALFDYNNKRDYRILIPSEDKITYNYSIDGIRIKGWKNPKSIEQVSQPPVQLVANKKDYIIITDENGNIKITDRKGKNRIVVKGDFTKGKNSSYYINKTNSKGTIITTNKLGHLIYISTKGKVQETIFGEFSEDHYFLYEDFDRNGYKDFIYLDGNTLTIFDRFKKVIFKYEFEAKVNSKPVFIKSTNTEKLLGIVLDSTRQVFLFDSKGKVLISTGLIGETPFTVGSLDMDGRMNLIVGAGSTLYNYELK